METSRLRLKYICLSILRFLVFLLPLHHILEAVVLFTPLHLSENFSYLQIICCISQGSDFHFYLSHILTPHLYFYLSTTVGHFYNTGEFTITAQTTQQLQNIT